MFRFAAESMLLAYLIVPLVAILYWWAWRRKQRDMARLIEPPLLERLAATVSHRRRLVKATLLLATLTLLVTALARPQFGSRVETVRREGRDIMVAIDLSASMAAEDIAPNRLDKAKFAVADLISRLTGDRVGLVAFAGEAFVQSPLTLDYGAARLFLNAMDLDMMSVQGTNLGQAVEVALDGFSDTDRRHRVLLVITDGEDHEAEVDEAVERAIAEGVEIFTMGIGSTVGVRPPAWTKRASRRSPTEPAALTTARRRAEPRWRCWPRS